MVEIGKEYALVKVSTQHHASAPRDHILGKMSEVLKAKVLENLATGEGSTTALYEATTRAASYLDLRNKIDMLKKLKGNTKHLKAQAAEMKAKAFPKPKRNAWDVCANAFIRAYKPENLEAIPIGKAVGSEKDLTAIYAGKYLTTTGKVIDRWFVTSPTMINEETLKLGLLAKFIEV